MYAFLHPAGLAQTRDRPLHNAPLQSSRKFRPSGKRPEKMAAAESRSTLDLLPEDLLCFGQRFLGFGFGERKLTQRSKRSSEAQDPVLII